MHNRLILSVVFIVVIFNTHAMAGEYTGITRAPTTFSDSFHENVRLINQFFGEEVAAVNVRKQSALLEKRFVGLSSEKLIELLQDNKKNFPRLVSIYNKDKYITVVFEFLYIDENERQVQDTKIYKFRSEDGIVRDAWEQGTTCFVGKDDKDYDKDPKVSQAPKAADRNSRTP